MSTIGYLAGETSCPPPLTLWQRQVAYAYKWALGIDWPTNYQMWVYLKYVPAPVWIAGFNAVLFYGNTPSQGGDGCSGPGKYIDVWGCSGMLGSRLSL